MFHNLAKHTLAFASLSCVCGALIVLRAANVANLQDLLIANKYSHDFGNQLQGSECETDLVLTNQSQQQIEITRVITSCSCTSAELDAKHLGPGASCKLHVSVNTDRPSDNLKASCTVVYNTPDSSVSHELLVSVLYSVKPLVECNPSTLYYDANKPSCRVLVLTTNDPPLSNVKLLCSNPAFTTKQLMCDASSRLAKYSVEYDGSLRGADHYVGRLAISFPLEQSPTVSVSLVCR